MRWLQISLALMVCMFVFATPASANSDKPMNVLLLIVDDLNTWLLEDPTRYTGKVVAPNIQRLSKQGVLFHNAYTASPVCSPSRTAFLSGVAPWKSGVSRNGVKVGDSLPLRHVPSLFKTFQDQGYWIAKFGKVSHGYDTGVTYEASMNHKRTPPPPGAPLNGIAKSGGGRVTERDWGPTHLDENEMSDKRLADATIEAIQREHDKPFFISCGLFHPHYPWYVPQKYLDLYPLDAIELPPIKKADLDDVPAHGRKLVNLGWDQKIQDQGLTREAIQGYLASVSFSDAHMGRILNALDESAHRDNTIVVLISDHGFHLGEKQNWTKGTLWEEATDSVMMFRVPGVTKANQVCTRPVSLHDLYPTLVDLAGTPKPKHLDGHTLVPLLKDVETARQQPAITVYDGHMSVRTESARFIRYWDGTTELYDLESDPHEWVNQTDNPQLAKLKQRMQNLLPTDVVPPLPSRQAGAVNQLPKEPKKAPGKRPSQNVEKRRRARTAESSIAAETFASTTPAAAKPNIVMILADDMAWYDTPVRMDDELENSAQEILRSLRDPEHPQQPYRWSLQQLADEGMLFRNAYSGAPQCTPTRACLQTGMTTARHRLSVELGGKGIGELNLKPELRNFPVIPSGVRKPFPPDMMTIPETLAPMGYRCAHYGKWHLEPDPASEGYADSDGDTDNNQGKTYDPTDRLIPADLTNAKRIDEITDKSIAFMKKQRDAGTPFYVQLSHYGLHAPWECTRSSRALFQNHPDVVAYNKGVTDPAKLNRKSDPAVFFGMVYELDQSIGRLMREIESLGLSSSTYVIFKSDNGYRRFDTQNFEQPFYGHKWFLWQAGIRVPMIVKGPGIPAGSVSEANVVTYDLLPTFYDWAGGDTSELRAVDGVSLKALMEGKEPTSEFLNRSLYFHYPHYRSSVPLSVVVKGHHKLVYSWDGTIRMDLSMSDPKMLFDLAKDPGEFHNLTPQNKELAESLWRDLDAYLNRVDARRPRDNSEAYRANQGKDFEADRNADDRKRYAPFEGSRK